MSITIDLSPDEVAEMREITRAADDATGVSIAAREYVRWRRLCELKAASGQFEFDDNWQQLEASELVERGPPKASCLASHTN